MRGVWRGSIDLSLDTINLEWRVFGRDACTSTYLSIKHHNDNGGSKHDPIRTLPCGNPNHTQMPHLIDCFIDAAADQMTQTTGATFHSLPRCSRIIHRT